MTQNAVLHEPGLGQEAAGEITGRHTQFLAEIVR
jgi:hypothetical protein